MMIEALRGPFFKYAGAKWLLSKHYPPPKYKTIVEPFAGSACYATRYADRNVILIEKDPEIAALWRWLIGVDEETVRSLPTEELVYGQDIRHLDIPYGGMLLMRAWQRVGRSDCWTISKWCGKPGLWDARARDRVADSLKAIRHWRILEGDCLSGLLPERFEATYFVDPPYQGLPVYRFKDVDYTHLGGWCRSRQGQVIVCERETARWLPFQPFRKVVTGRRGQACSKGPSKEGIWTSE